MKSRALDWLIAVFTLAILAAGVSLVLFDFSGWQPQAWEAFQAWLSESGTRRWILFLFFSFAGPAIALFVIVPFALEVLRKGRYQAYGQRLTRAQNPVTFWLAIVNWLAVSAVSIIVGIAAFVKLLPTL